MTAGVSSLNYLAGSTGARAPAAATTLATLGALRLAVDRIDAPTGRDDLVADFSTHGLFVFMNNTSWS